MTTMCLDIEALRPQREHLSADSVDMPNPVRLASLLRVRYYCRSNYRFVAALGVTVASGPMAIEDCSRAWRFCFVICFGRSPPTVTSLSSMHDPSIHDTEKRTISDAAYIRPYRNVFTVKNNWYISISVTDDRNTVTLCSSTEQR